MTSLQQIRISEIPYKKETHGVSFMKMYKDLGKTVKQILSENTGAVIVKKDLIQQGTGGIFGEGQFIAWNWKFKNDRCYIAEYYGYRTDTLYNSLVEEAQISYGQGLHINQLHQWITPEYIEYTLAEIGDLLIVCWVTNEITPLPY